MTAAVPSPPWLSTGAFRSTDLAAIVAEAEACGYRQIELSSGCAHAPDQLAPVHRTNGRIRYLVHNYFPPPERPFVLNLAATDAEALALSLNLCREAIDLAARLGAPFYSVHSGFAMRLQARHLGDPDAQRALGPAALVPWDTAWAVFRESVAALCDYAHARGLRLLVENNVVSPRYAPDGVNRGLLLATADEILRFAAEVDHPAFGLLLDVGHAKVSGTALRFDPRELVERVAPLIGAFHLSDNDGQTDSNRTFDADAWFCPLLPRFAHLPMVVEVYRMEADTARRQLDLAAAVLEGTRP